MKSIKNKTFSQVLSEGLFDEPINKYHKTKAVGSTHLRTFLKSPAQFVDLWLHGYQKKSEAFTIGSALHGLVLEPDKFHDRFACAPEINRRTNAGKAEWQSFCEDNEGKEILSKDQISLSVKMSTSIHGNELASYLLRNTKREQSARVKLTNGLVAQCRPDALCLNKIIDVKTCSSLEKFKYEVKTYGYDIQAAFYYFILSRLFPEQYGSADFYFIVVDKTNINEVMVTGLDNETLKMILDEKVKPALAELGEFFGLVKDFSSYRPQQKETKWMNII